MIVYLAVCRANQKAYVGQTRKSLNVRRSGHNNTRRQIFHSAIAKYGRDSFDWTVLEECVTLAEANTAEKKWIAHFGCIAPVGYNVATGGGGTPGVKLKPHQIALLAAMRRGKLPWNAGMDMPPEWMTPEHAAKISRSLKAKYAVTPHHQSGREMPDDVRAKIAANHQAKKVNVGPKNGMYGKPSPRRGATHTESAKAKNRAAALDRWSNPDMRARYVANRKGKPWSAARRAAQERKSP